MKYFRTILCSILIVTIILYVADIIFISSIYNSIKARYIDDVEQCLRRADLIEVINRLDSAGFANEKGVIPVYTGLMNEDIGAAQTAEELEAATYSQGYKRMDRQLISVLTKFLHESYKDEIGDPNISVLEQAFRRELNFSGYYPKEVIIIPAQDSTRWVSGLWELEHRVDGELICKAYISPLTGNILNEMKGMIVVTIAITLVFAFAFWYLMYNIKRLRTIEEMKDDFVSNITHELKTPIAIAFSANDALLNYDMSNDPDKKKAYLTIAIKQLKRLGELVEKILSMSMEKRKTMTLKPEHILLPAFIREIVESESMRADKEINFDVSVEDNAVLTADKSHLSNVLNNLIDNAIKYSGDSVNISINITADTISVSDNGIGIPSKSLPYIFEKFYRVPHGNRQDVRGYGIGLYYVKHILEKMNASITVNSKEGVGTTFIIKFNPNEN